MPGNPREGKTEILPNLNITLYRFSFSVFANDVLSPGFEKVGIAKRMECMWIPAFPEELPSEKAGIYTSGSNYVSLL